MTPFTIALLKPDDAVAYRVLRLEGLSRHPEAFTSSAEEESRKPIEWYRQRISPDQDAPHDFFLGAWKDGDLKGTVGLQGKYRFKEHHVATVVGMYVAPVGRGSGLGRALMDELLARARALALLETLQLTVTKGNDTAQRLYVQCGFTVWGEDFDAIRVGGHGYSKVHMALRLRSGATAA